MSAGQSFLDFTEGPQEFDPKALLIAPSTHAEARETSALAAVKNTKRSTPQCLTILAVLREAGERGLSDIEIHRITKLSRQTICARRGDLGELLEPYGRHTDAQTGSTFTRWRLVKGSNQETQIGAEQ